MERGANGFRQPLWGAPLDPEAVLARVSPDATMKGVYLEAIANAARDAGVTLPSARERYTSFRAYPLVEHCRLLVEAASTLWPERSVRRGLRSLGRGAPEAILASIVGRVTVGSVEGPIETLRAMAKTYSLVMEPGSATVAEAGPGRAVVELRDVPFFLDSHHVGVFEGTLKFAGEDEPRVQIRDVSDADADLLCEWGA